MKRKTILSVFLVITIVAVALVSAISLGFLPFLSPEPGPTAYGTLYLGTEWWETVRPTQPHFTLTIFNEGRWDFTVTKVVLAGITVWTGRLVVPSDGTEELVIPDVSQVFEQIDPLSPNVLDEVFIEESTRTPAFQHNIVLGRDNSTEGYEDGHTVVGAGIPVSFPSLAPPWLSVGQYAEYLQTIENSTGSYAFRQRWEVIELNVADSSMSVKFEYPNPAPWDFDPRTDEVNPHDFTDYLTPTQIDLVKERPAWFLGFLPVTYAGTAVISTSFGSLNTIALELTDPQIEGQVWIHLNTGLLVKYEISFTGTEGLITVTSELVETNILES